MQKRDIKQLRDFSYKMAKLFEEGKIHYPLHLSGGNEKQLIKIFKKIKPRDYVFSTHRSHYHYLLKGGKEKILEEKIMKGKSMSVFDKKLNFLTSSIVAGTCPIAVGVALALKMKKSKRHVWCFLGDGATDEGHFWEAVRYADGWKLPITFVVEDNDRSVETPYEARYNKNKLKLPKDVIYYKYKRIFPHVGIGKWVTF